MHSYIGFAVALLGLILLNVTVDARTAREIIDYVNSHSFGWKAGNHFEELDDNSLGALLGTRRDRASQQQLEDLEILLHREPRLKPSDEAFGEQLFESFLGAQRSPNVHFTNILVRSSVDERAHSIPDEFDARQAFPECHKLIAHIRDQSACGSCWAIAPAAAISDRVCIASQGNTQVHLSTSDILSCCKPAMCGAGCNGGYPTGAWSYWVKQGLVSGGEFDPRFGHRLDEFPAKDPNDTHEVPVLLSSKRLDSGDDQSGQVPIDSFDDNNFLPPWEDQAILRPAGQPLNEILLPSKLKTEMLLSPDGVVRLAEKVRLPQELMGKVDHIRFDSNHNSSDNEVDENDLGSSTCWPYDYEPCEHHTNGSRPACNKVKMLPTPACRKECVSGYGRTFAQDKHYGSVAYRLLAREQQIQLELMRHGPVTVAFEVNEDFLHYKSGIYKATVKKVVGGHAVKLIGWGTENGIPYWLLQNSWNTDWGEEGLFRFIRGEDHCGIESEVVAGLPRHK